MTSILRHMALAACLCLGPLAPLPSAAQNLFAPVATVNSRAITVFEREQRARMLALFRAPGDLQEAALNSLIDERLQLETGERLEIVLTPAEILRGMEEFAGRANLGREEFIQALAAAGVEEETFRDFVSAGLIWRKVIRERFGGRAVIGEVDIDRAASDARVSGGTRVLLSEIVLRADSPAAEAAARRRAAQLSDIASVPSFASAAQRYSVASSRSRGGAVDWSSIGDLPPQVAAAVRGLSPGQITPPIAIPNGIALFQLREIAEVPEPTPEAGNLDYAAFYIPGGRTPGALAEAARISARARTAATTSIPSPAACLPNGSSATRCLCRKCRRTSRSSCRASIPARSRRLSPGPRAKPSSSSCSATAPMRRRR